MEGEVGAATGIAAIEAAGGVAAWGELVEGVAEVAYAGLAGGFAGGASGVVAVDEGHVVILLLV